MTCQWCKFYRRRDGISYCFVSEKPARITTLACDRFDARRSCTTCEYRCPAEERERLSAGGACQKWELRHLDKWGGYRGRTRVRFGKVNVENKEVKR